MVFNERKRATGEACFHRGSEFLCEEAYSKATEYFRKGAEKFNDVDCQYALGKQYLDGHVDGKVNIELAHYWLKKAVEGGASEYNLLYLLGIICLVGGEGVARDEREAFSWIEKAALFDNECYRIIGKGYCQGKLPTRLGYSQSADVLKLEVNYEKALEYFLIAIKSDPEDFETYEKIARIYFDGGHGVEVDYEKALFWSEKCLSKTSDLKCIKMIVQIYSTGGFGVTKNVQKAIEWCTKHGDLLYLDTGLLYQYHIYPPDYKNAFIWYEKAVNSEFNSSDDMMANYSLHEKFEYFDYTRNEASVKLGLLYLKGLGVKKDHHKASLYLSKDFDRYWGGYLSHYGVGPNVVDYDTAYRCYKNVEVYDEYYYGEAMNQLGILYQDGLGVPQSHKKAIGYFKLAVDKDCSEAYNSMGDVYRYGYGVDIDYEKAFEWYTKAAKEPFDNNGQFNLGTMYLEGKGTEINLELALHWFEKAQIFGNENVHPSLIALAKALLNTTKSSSMSQECTNAKISIPKEPRQFFHV